MTYFKLTIKLLMVTLMIYSFHNCNSVNDKDQGKNKNRLKQDSLAFELCMIYGSDQGIRDMKLITRAETGAVKFSPFLDSINFYKIIVFVKENGVPNKELLGEENYSNECVAGAFGAVLLHTSHMLINNKKYLNLFLEEVNKGNMKRETLALVLDKYYLIRRDEFGNRKLLYGSQFGKPCRKYRKKSDSVRVIIGLKPLPDSLFIDCKSKK